MTAVLIDAPAVVPARERIERALSAAAAVDGGKIARATGTPEEIRKRVRDARLDAIRREVMSNE